MQCPKCERDEDKVIDSRSSKDNTIRRRRQCLKCGHRFTTSEEIVKPEKLKVLKRNGGSDDFSRDKLRTSLERACYKRPVTPEQLRDVTDRIYDELASRFGRDVTNQQIGECVMNELRAVDKVAYIRYASTYREFQEPDEFLSEIKKLERPHDTLTIRLPGV
jgi:transcriptional repressor NrdR